MITVSEELAEKQLAHLAFTTDHVSLQKAIGLIALVSSAWESDFLLYEVCSRFRIVSVWMTTYGDEVCGGQVSYPRPEPETNVPAPLSS